MAALILLTTALSSSVLAQQEPLADRVPSDALLYVGWEGKSRMGERYAGSKLKQYIEVMNLSAEWTKLTDTIKAQAPTQGADAQKFDALVQILPSVWDKPWVFYIRDLPEVPQPGQKADPKKPALKLSEPYDLLRAALLIDAGDQAAEIAQRVTLFVNDGSPHSPKVEVAGSWVVVQVNLPDLAAEVRSGGPVKGQKLSDNAGFRAAMNTIKFQGKPSLAFYSDTLRWQESITRWAKATSTTEEQRDWRGFQDVTGLPGLHSVSYAAGFAEQGWTSGALISAPAATRKGLVKWYVDSTPISPETLALLPVNASWFKAVRLDMDATISLFLDFKRTVTPPAQQLDLGAAAAGKDADEDLFAEVNKALGFDLRQDLLSQIGPDWVMFTDPFAVGPTGLGIVLATPVRDVARVERAMTRIEGQVNAMFAQRNNPGAAPGAVPAGMQFQVVEQGGIKLHLLNAIFASPTWAIHNGTLYFSPLTQSVIAAAQAPAMNKSITQPNAKQLVPLAQRFVPAGCKAISLSGADLTVTAPIVYNQYMTLTQMLPMMMAQQGVKAPPYVLPPLQPIIATLGNATGAAWTDDSGYYSRSLSPFPTALTTWSPQLMAGAPAPMLVGILLPALGAARRTATQMQANTQARGIQGACVLYAQANKGKYPPDLGTLVINNFFTVDYAISPNATTTVPAGFAGWPKPQQAAWVNKNASFVLIAGGTDNIDAERIDVVEKILKPNMPRIAVAFGDNHVELRLVEDVRQKLLKQTGKTLEQLGIAPGGMNLGPATAQPASPINKPAPAPAPGTTKGAPR